MKGFNIAPAPNTTTTKLEPVSELMQTLTEHQNDPDVADLFPGITPKKQLHGNPIHPYSSSQSSFSESHHMIAKLGKFAPNFHKKRNGSHKRRWGTLIEAAKSGSAKFIGRSRSEDSVCNTPGNTQMESVSQSNSPGSEDGATDTQTDSNHSLDHNDDHTNNTQDDHKHHHHLHGLTV